MSGPKRVVADLNRIFDLIGELNPELMWERVGYYRKGGLPAGQGVRGSERPLPLPDRVDQQLSRAKSDFDNGIIGAARFLASAVQAQRSVVNITQDVPDEPLFRCINWKHCGGWTERGSVKEPAMCDGCRKRASREKESA